MDEETEHLRDLFVDVTDGESATTAQSADRGTLQTDDAAVDERIGDVVSAVEAAFDRSVSLPRAALVELVEAVHAGVDDATVAERLTDPDGPLPADVATDLAERGPGDDDRPPVDAATVRRTRWALHCFRPDDPTIDGSDLEGDGLDGNGLDADGLDGDGLAVVKERLEDDPAEVAADLVVAPGVVADLQAYLRARREARGVSYRYAAAFEDALTDADIDARLTDAVREDGLWEATEDIGSLEEDADVDF